MSVLELREQLRTEVVDRPEFSWLKNVVDKTLDEFVSEALQEQPPDPQSFIPSRIDEHLSEVSKLLDICSQKRNIIFSLEGQALLTAREYLSAESLEDSDKAILLMSLRSMRITAGLAPDDESDKEFANLRISRLREQRLAKIALHSVTGSALNFGERIEHERNMYATNLLTIFERIHALKKSHVGSLMGEVPDIETWDGGLDVLVYLIRGLFFSIDRQCQHEVTTEYLVDMLDFAQLGMPPLIQSVEAVEKLTNNGVFEVSIEITPELLHKSNPLAENFDPDTVRMVGFALSLPLLTSHISANSAEEAWRAGKIFDNAKITMSQTSFSCDIQPPSQSTKNGEYGWHPARVKLPPLMFASGARQPPSHVPELSGLCPFGTWRLRVFQKTRNSNSNLNLIGVAQQLREAMWSFNINMTLALRYVPTETGGGYYMDGNNGPSEEADLLSGDNVGAQDDPSPFPTSKG